MTTRFDVAPESSTLPFRPGCPRCATGHRAWDGTGDGRCVASREDRHATAQIARCGARLRRRARTYTERPPRVGRRLGRPRRVLLHRSCFASVCVHLEMPRPERDRNARSDSHSSLRISHIRSCRLQCTLRCSRASSATRLSMASRTSSRASSTVHAQGQWPDFENSGTCADQTPCPICAVIHKPRVV